MATLSLVSESCLGWALATPAGCLSGSRSRMGEAASSRPVPGGTVRMEYGREGSVGGREPLQDEETE